MAAEPLDPVDLDDLEAHVVQFNQQLLASFWRFQSTAMIEMIRELRELRALVDEWSPIVGDYLAQGLSEPRE